MLLEVPSAWRHRDSEPTKWNGLDLAAAVQEHARKVRWILSTTQTTERSHFQTSFDGMTRAP